MMVAVPPKDIRRELLAGFLIEKITLGESRAGDLARP